ncbi:unknown [Haloarcula marismortui ATCC 43049]|nr:unknown [Haloarcula marismortui ATCC 43049]
MWPSGAGDSTATRQQTAADNDTGQYRVAGSVNVTLLGEPYPGSTVPLVATVDGVPVRNATVSHDGDIVGRTDTTGQSQLTVPDTDTTAVTVSRGEFEGTARVDVLNLHVRVMPAKTLPVPGDSAAVNATRNGEAVKNATVTLGDQRRGTTGADGTVAVSLPANPSLTVTAATDRQTARTTLWDAYIGTVVVSSVLLVTTVVTIAIAALLYTPRVARGIGVLWALFDSLFFIGVLWERDGLAIALTVVSVAALYHYRADALSGGQAVAYAVKNSGKMLAGYVARVVQLSRRTALWLVGRIEAMLSIGRRLAIRLAAWLASLPLTVTGLSRRFQQWLRSAGYRAITVARAETTPRRIVTLGFSCVVVILSYVRWGTTGAAVAVAGVGLGAVSVYTSGLTDDTDRPTAASSSGPSESVTDSSDGDESALPSLRDIWRAFARHVVPGHWRTRTPGEVSRAAIDSGLPRAPVEALTEAFRDVEYGGQSSDSRREQARNAYDALVSASDEQEDTE